ncbi:hypothetical protein Fcan01_07345 [Folsomia candida]|uniref:CRAL-TRIO domain-containing protein n=2 Tax=Folsomia candida TaxID=158441 RepID=A0A226EM64_FOLCA|nr:hypothetical protein Fcan01_07345 [Folsomia candida]
MTLIRFLIAREFNIEAAENMLRSSMQWRKDHRMDHIFEWKSPEYLHKDLPYSIPGFDKNGGPVVHIPFGKWNHRCWVEKGYGEDLLRWGYRLIEDAFQKATSDGLRQCTAIFDLGGISYYQAAHIPSLKVLYNGFKALEQNYPEMLKSIVIVNAPWLFAIPFNFIKGTISPNTLSKLKIFDSNKKIWLDYLLERCPEKSLPKAYFEDQNGN